MSGEEKPRLEATEQGYRLSGPLTFATVPELARMEAPGGEVDLGGVTRADSAGLALLLDWLAGARRSAIPLEFHHLPAQLDAIARVSGIVEVLDHDHG
ncbi:MAG: STAS domain-containing protein [Thiohalospira sp.]|uniref:STAS domain-containing protein n=1 Tax=Thiohalospira sp. TaxID=3080549 RepID=UPI00397ECF90